MRILRKIFHLMQHCSYIKLNTLHRRFFFPTLKMFLFQIKGFPELQRSVLPEWRFVMFYISLNRVFFDS